MGISTDSDKKENDAAESRVGICRRGALAAYLAGELSPDNYNDLLREMDLIG